MSHRIHTRRRGGVLALGLLLAALLAGIASPAFAHDELLGTDPAQGSTVDTLPEQITMTFSGVLLADAGASEIEVLDASCRSLASGDPVFDGTRVHQAVSGDVAGPITVVWRVVSSDGHPIDGTWGFTIAGGDGGDQTPCASAPDGTQGGDFDPTVLLIVGGVIVAIVVVAIVLLARKRPSDED